MGRPTLTGAGVHVTRMIASNGLPACATRTAIRSPGCTTAMGTLGEPSSRHTEQLTPVTNTRCADPSPAFTSSVRSPATFGPESRWRWPTSHSAVGRPRACSHNVKPVEIAVAAVAAAVVASQNSCASIAAASQTSTRHGGGSR